MKFRLRNIPWDRVASDLQGRLENAGITVLSLVFFDNLHSKAGSLFVPLDQAEKVRKLHGMMYGGKKLYVTAAGRA